MWIQPHVHNDQENYSLQTLRDPHKYDKREFPTPDINNSNKKMTKDHPNVSLGFIWGPI